MVSPSGSASRWVGPLSVNDGFSCRWLDFTQYHCENAAVPGTNYCEKHTENLANYADYLQRMYGEPR